MKGSQLILILCTLALLLNTQGQDRSPINSVHREIAITFDDLPLQGPPLGIDKLRDMTAKLLHSINANNVPAFGDVNEAKLYRNGRLDPARVAILKMWLDAGLELGNHTFSHADINKTPLAAYEQEIIRGETVTAGLLRERGMKLRYFRHPFLHAGSDAE